MEFPKMISTGRYECIVCRVNRDNLADLHRHQTYRHTTEELSFASIVLRSNFLNKHEINNEIHYLRSWLCNPENFSHLYAYSSILLNDGNNNFNHNVPLNCVLEKNHSHENSDLRSMIKFSDIDHNRKIDKFVRRKNCGVLDLSCNISDKRLENSSIPDSQDVEDHAQDDSQIEDNTDEDHHEVIVGANEEIGFLTSESQKFGSLEKSTSASRRKPRLFRIFDTPVNSPGRLEIISDNENDREITDEDIEVEDSESEEAPLKHRSIKRLENSPISHSQDEEDRSQDDSQIEDNTDEDHHEVIVGANEEIGFLTSESRRVGSLEKSTSASRRNLRLHRIFDTSVNSPRRLEITLDNKNDQGTTAEDIEIKDLMSEKALLKHQNIECLENSPIPNSQDMEDRVQDDSQIEDNAVEETEWKIVKKKKSRRKWGVSRRRKGRKKIRKHLASAQNDREEMDVSKSMKVNGENEKKGVVEPKIPRMTVKFAKKRSKIFDTGDYQDTLVNVVNDLGETVKVSMKLKKVTRSQTNLLKNPMELTNTVKTPQFALRSNDQPEKIFVANQEVNSLSLGADLAITTENLSQDEMIENHGKRSKKLSIVVDNVENPEEIDENIKIDDSRSTEEIKRRKMKRNSRNLPKVPKKQGKLLEIPIDSEDHREETMEENNEMNFSITKTKIILPMRSKRTTKKKFSPPTIIDSANTAEMLNIPSDIEECGEEVIGENGEIRFLVPGTEITIPARRKSVMNKKNAQSKINRHPVQRVNRLNIPSDDEYHREEILQDRQIDESEIGKVPARWTRSTRSKVTALKPIEVAKKPVEIQECPFLIEDHHDVMVGANEEIDFLTQESQSVGSLEKPAFASRRKLRPRRIFETPVNTPRRLEMASDNENNCEESARDIEIKDLESKVAPLKHRKSTKTGVTRRKLQKSLKKAAMLRKIELYGKNDPEKMSQENKEIEEPEVSDEVERNSFQTSENSQDTPESMESKIAAFQQTKTFPHYPRNMDERSILVYDPVISGLVWTSFELTDDPAYNNDENENESQSEQELTIVEYDVPQVQDYVNYENSISYGILPCRLDEENEPSGPDDVPNDQDSMPKYQKNMPNDPDDLNERVNVPNDRENIPNSREDVPNDRENMPDAQEDVPNDRENIPNSREDVPNDRENMPDAQEDVPNDRENMPDAQEDVPNDRENMPDAQEDVLNDRENMPNSRKDIPVHEDLRNGREGQPDDSENTSIDSDNTSTEPNDVPTDSEYEPYDRENTSIDSAKSTTNDPINIWSKSEHTSDDLENIPADSKNTLIDLQYTPNDLINMSTDSECTLSEPENTFSDLESTSDDPKNKLIDLEYTPKDPKNKLIDLEYTPNDPKNTLIDLKYTPNDPLALSQSVVYENTSKDEENSTKMFLSPRPRRIRSTPNRYVPY